MAQINENPFLKASKTGKEVLGILAALLILTGLVLVFKGLATNYTFSDLVIKSPSSYRESSTATRTKMAEKDGVTALLHYERFTSRRIMYFRKQSDGAESYVDLPLDTTAGWSNASYVWTGDDLYIFSGTPMHLRHYTLSGSPLPTSAAHQSTQEFGDSDSRPGEIIRLSSGTLLVVWHQQENPQGHHFAYKKSDQSSWSTFSHSLGPTRASKEALVQHPDDGTVWMFSNADAFGRIGAMKMTEVSSGFRIDWSNSRWSENFGDFNAEPSNPRVVAAADSNAGEIVVAYQSAKREIFSTDPFIAGSWPAVVRIRADETRTFTHLPVYVERIASLGLTVRTNEVWLGYHKLDTDALTFDTLDASKLENGSWTHYSLGRTLGGYQVINSGISRPEFVSLMSDSKLHFHYFTESGSPPPSDTSPPVTSITSPANGSTVSGTVSVAASASDNVGVSRVEFFIDGSLAGTDTSSPYTYSWNTANFTNASHSLFTKAYDAAGNIGTSATISITVSNSAPPPSDTTSPTVSITSPADGATVDRRSTITITASASDNVGVTKVEFYVNNSLQCTDTVSSYTCSWKIPGAKNRTYTITAKAYDAAGNTSEHVINVTAR